MAKTRGAFRKKLGEKDERIICPICYRTCGKIERYRAYCIDCGVDFHTLTGKAAMVDFNGERVRMSEKEFNERFNSESAVRSRKLNSWRKELSEQPVVVPQPKEIPKTRLFSLREQTGLGQHEFAQAVGISNFTIGKYERGYAPMTDMQLGLLLKLADYCGVEPEYLLIEGE